MRNILFFLISVSVFLVSEKSYGFSLSPRLGFFWGQGEEIVYNPYWNSSSNQNIYWSRLLWDFKPLVYMGVDLEFGPDSKRGNNGFSTLLSLKYGLPIRTGIMENRDWIADNASYLTHFSEHDASSGLSTFTAELSMGYSWAFSSGAWIKLLGELSLLRFSWLSKDGYTQYGQNNHGYSSAYVPWDSSWKKDSHYGPAIDYAQNWIILAPGLVVGINLSGNLSVSLTSAWTPFAYGYCRDDHLHPEKTVTYLDFLYWGMSIKEELALNFIMNETLELGASAALRHLSSARGNTFISDSGDPYYSAGSTAGGGFMFFDFSVSAKFVF